MRRLKRDVLQQLPKKRRQQVCGGGGGVEGGGGLSGGVDNWGVERWECW